MHTVHAYIRVWVHDGLPGVYALVEITAHIVIEVLSMRGHLGTLLQAGHLSWCTVCSGEVTTIGCAQ